MCRQGDREVVAVGFIEPSASETSVPPGSTVALLDPATGEELSRLVSNQWSSDYLAWDGALRRLIAFDER